MEAASRCKHGKREMKWRVDRTASVGLNDRMPEPTDSSQQDAQKKPLRDLVDRTADTVKKRPVNSIVWSFFIGIFLTIFPVGRIVGALVSLVLALLRPALMLLGVVRLFEEVERRRK